MPVRFKDLGQIKADGRSILHMQSDDVASDVAELEYILTRYEVIAAGHSVWLLEKFPKPRQE